MNLFVKNYLKSFLLLSINARILLFFYMIQSISAGAAFFIAIFLDVHLHLSAETIGIIVSIFIVGNLSGSWLITLMLDKLSPFKISAFSSLLQGLSFIILSLNDSIFIIGLAMYLLGVSGYSYVVSAEYLIIKTAGDTDEHRSRAISFINVASNIGVGLGGCFVSFLSEDHPKLLLSFIGLLLIFLSIYYLSKHKRIDYIKEKALYKDSDATTQAGQSIYYYLSLFVILVLGLIFAQQRVSYSIYLAQNFGASEISSLLLLNSLLIILFLPGINSITEKYNGFFMMGLGGLMLGGGMSLYQFTSSYLIVILICIVITIGEMLSTLLTQLICFQFAKSGKQGKAMGYYKLLYSLGTVIGTSTGGAIQTHLGINMIWSFCGLLGIVIFSCSLIGVFKHQKLSYSLG